LSYYDSSVKPQLKEKTNINGKEYINPVKVKSLSYYDDEEEESKIDT